MIASPTEIAYFMEILQQRHISRAAMRLGISQPTLTQSLLRLEAKLKTQLFYRTKQGVIPTPSASIFYTRAKLLKECWSDMEQAVHSSANAIEGSFRLGCHQSVGAYTLPTLFRNLQREAPGLEINLLHDFSRKITEAIVSYEIDLGYVVNPVKHLDLVLKKMGDDRVTFWKSQSKNKIPRIIFADGSRKQVDELLGKTFDKHFKGWSITQSTSLELIRTLTQKGLGIGVLPERVARVDQGTLTIYDSQLPHKPDEIFLAYRKEVLSSKAGKELLRLASFKL